MSKLSVYRGIDPLDGADSLFLVVDGIVGATWYDKDSCWLSKDSLGDPDSWLRGSSPIDGDRYRNMVDFKLLWEADM